MAMMGFAPMAAAAIAGEMACSLVSNLVRLGDGSWVAVQTDKPAYYAGETMTGKVVAHINGPVACDRVLVKVRCKERVFWHDEIARTEWEGEGEHRRSRTVYEHVLRQGKQTLFKDIIVASNLNHVLPPGEWQYPFSYKLPESLPGVAKYHKSEPFQDPHYRGRGSKETTASIIFSVKAVLDSRGVFSRELRSRSELVVNPYFNWDTLQRQSAFKKGEVYWMCCIAQGQVTLDCKFDKGAYAGGETAQISATIVNDSACDVGKMKVKLMRFITLRDRVLGGSSKVFTDCVAQAVYDGVPRKSNAARSLPLPLRGPLGPFIPSVKGSLVDVRYQIEVECDISMAFDIEAHLPVLIYEPPPQVYGLAAFFPGGSPGFAPAPVAPVLPVVAPVVPMMAPVVPAAGAGFVNPMAGAGAMPIMPPAGGGMINPMMAGGPDAAMMGGMSSPGMSGGGMMMSASSPMPGGGTMTTSSAAMTMGGGDMGGMGGMNMNMHMSTTTTTTSQTTGMQSF